MSRAELLAAWSVLYFTAEVCLWQLLRGPAARLRRWLRRRRHVREGAAW